MQPNSMAGEPVRGARQEAERNDDRIGWHDMLRAGDGLGYAASARIRGTQRRLYEFHSLHPFGSDDLDGLTVEEKLHAFFLAVLVVAPRAGHVAFVAPVGAGHRLGSLADRS